MPKDLFNKLNNYDYSEENIDMIIEFPNSGIIPGTLTAQQKCAFKKKYSKDFVSDGKDVYYSPLDLLLVREFMKEEVLKASYDDPSISLGAGIENFYNKLCSKYLGITYNDTRDFLQKQTSYK